MVHTGSATTNSCKKCFLIHGCGCRVARAPRYPCICHRTTAAPLGGRALCVVLPAVGLRGLPLTSSPIDPEPQESVCEHLPDKLLHPKMGWLSLSLRTYTSGKSKACSPAAVFHSTAQRSGAVRTRPEALAKKLFVCPAGIQISECQQRHLCARPSWLEQAVVPAMFVHVIVR